MHLMADIRDLDRCIGDKSGQWFVKYGPGGRRITNESQPESADASGADGAVRAIQLDAFDPTLFIYDAYPGGIGFSDQLFALHDQLVEAARHLIRSCPCEAGCPSCVGPILEVGARGKEVALAISGLHAMSVKSRLTRLTGEAPAGPSAPDSAKNETLSRLRQRINEVVERPSTRRASSSGAKTCPLVGLIADSEDLQTEAGSVLILHSRHHQGARHGSKRIGELAARKGAHAAILAGHPALATFDFREALFLDTETTGLAGGTGTLAFLVGLGWYDGDSFVVRQLFARDYGEEAALLTVLAELAAEKRFLVTFNGKAFDINLLTTRFILNRLKDPFIGMPHLDLLHPARRLIGHRLENSRLATLEEQVLGFFREGDIPGSEIPQRYFAWLRRRRPELVLDIFEHNRLDVISMAALTLHLCDLLACGVEAEGVHHADVLAASRLCLDRGHADESERLLDGVIRGGDSGKQGEAKRMRSLRYRRQGRWEEAAALWREMVETDPSDLFALVELAKWHEHRKRDFESAARMTRSALERVGSADVREKLLLRLDRLERRASLRKIRGKT